MERLANDFKREIEDRQETILDDYSSRYSSDTGSYYTDDSCASAYEKAVDEIMALPYYDFNEMLSQELYGDIAETFDMNDEDFYEGFLYPFLLKKFQQHVKGEQQ
jgi:hypothetical protein